MILERPICSQLALRALVSLGFCAEWGCEALSCGCQNFNSASNACDSGSYFLELKIDWNKQTHFQRIFIFYALLIFSDRYCHQNHRFPQNSNSRTSLLRDLRGCRNRSPALVLWKSRLGYVYWDCFSNALRGGGCAFQLGIDLVGKNRRLSDFLRSRVGGTLHSIDLG